MERYLRADLHAARVTMSVLNEVGKPAATTVIAQSRPNSLRDDYDRLLANGTKPNLAKLSAARKMAATGRGEASVPRPPFRRPR